MTTNPTLMAASAATGAGDTITVQQLEAAAADGRAAGRLEHTSGRRQPCPYGLGTLRAHVWLRWYVRARQTAVGVPTPR